MKRSIALVVALGLGLASPVVMAAEPGGASDVRVVQLQTIYAEAQSRVDRYNGTRDGAQLIVARELLLRWLTDHRVLYGDSAEAVAQRATVQQQLSLVDTELMRLSTPAVATPAVVAVVPAPVPPDPAVVAARQRAQRFVNAGAVAFAAGALTGIAVVMPLWATRNRALRKAGQQRFRVDEQVFLARARRRQVGAITTSVIGGSLVVLGVALLAVGLAKRGEARRMSLAPQAGRGYGGASLTLRF